jgi:LAS superfamily LD-carboxypeptidase LdcB
MKLLLILLIFIFFGCRQDQKSQVESNQIDAQMEKIEQDTIGKTYLMGKFNPESHPDFVSIDGKYADRTGLYLRKEVMEAYIKMFDQAKSENVDLVIKSATRNFNYQKGIWERKWTGATTLSDGTNLGKKNWSDLEKALKILEYSSMPGTSRHHWGTDFDLNAFENEWFESGEGKRVYDWLSVKAESFGFVQVYTPKGDARPFGYNEEKWHWSYKPLSSMYLNEAKQSLRNRDFSGFSGSDTAAEIDVVEKYILGVNPACF